MQKVDKLRFNENAEDDLCIYESDFKIMIKRKADTHAMLYFTNKNDEKIMVPLNIEVNNTKYSSLRQFPINDEYVLCWLYPYTIVLNNKILFNFSSEKSFIITPPSF